MALKIRIVVGMGFELEGVSELEARSAVQQFLLLDPNKPAPRGMRRVSRHYKMGKRIE